MEQPGIHQKHFHPVDYVVFFTMFVLSLGIGAIFAFRSRKRNTTDEYLMGNRKLGLVPVAISICVSVVSANTLLGAPAELYNYGIMYSFICIPNILTTMIIALWFVPLLYPLKLTSAHKYLYLRFNSKAAQLIGTTLLLISQVLYIGCVMFGPATALETVTGIPPWASIVLVGVIGTIYTAFGGMKAVIWTDVFQSTVMAAGLVAIIIEGSRKLGGFSNIWNVNLENGRLNVNYGTNLTDRYTVVSTILGFGAFWLAVNGVNQPCVQRYCAMETERRGKLSMLLNGPVFVLFTILSTMAGMVAFAYYNIKGCDPLSAGFISNGNQIMPYFVMEILGYPGLPGLFVSSIFSGSLSTLSSSINSMAAVVWEDLLVNHFNHFAENTKTWITKGISILFGLVCMGMSFIVLTIGGNLIQLAVSFLGVSMGPLLGIFVLGALVPWANWVGAVVGSLTALAFNLWLLFGQTFMKTHRKRLPTRTDRCFVQSVYNQTTQFVNNWTTEPTQSSLFTESSMLQPAKSSWLNALYSVSFNWYPVIGCIIVLLIGMLISAITMRLNEENIDDRLFFPCVNSCRPKKYTQVERSTSFMMETNPSHRKI